MASAKRVTAGILFSIALVAIFAFLFLLFVDAENVDSVPGVDRVFEIAVAIAIVLAAIALILLLLVLARKKPDHDDEGDVYFISGSDDSSATTPVVTGEHEGHPHEYREPLPPGSEPSGAPDVVAHDLRHVPHVLRSWSLSEDDAVYSFPCAVHHGVYSNDYIDLGGGGRLKLRTLLAGPEDIDPYVVQEPEPTQATSENEGWDPEPSNQESTAGAAGDGTDDAGSRPSRPSRTEVRRDESGDDFFREMDHRFS